MKHQTSSESLNVDKLVELIRRPYRSLHGRVSNACQTRWLNNEFLKVAKQASLGTYLCTARITSCIIGLCELLASRLTVEENELWNNFVIVDERLTATLSVHHSNLEWLLQQFNSSPWQVEAWIHKSACLASSDGEIDFADLLQLVSTRNPSLAATAHAMRNSIIHMWSIATGSESASCMRADTINMLRTRCQKMDYHQLSDALSTYQRSLLLTCCWCCEEQILDQIKPKSASVMGALVIVLRTLCRKMTPGQRALWKMLNDRSGNFNALFTLEDVHAGLEITVPIDEIRKGSKAKIHGLWGLRQQTQRKSLCLLFRTADSKVSLAKVCYWWNSMETGFVIPSFLMDKMADCEPEEIFSRDLQIAASNHRIARKALQAHVHVLAQFKAAALWESMEELHDQYALTVSLTNTSDSEDGETSMVCTHDEHTEDDTVFVSTRPSSSTPSTCDSSTYDQDVSWSPSQHREFSWHAQSKAPNF